MFLLAKAAHDTCLGGSAATCNNTQSNINRIYQKKNGALNMAELCKI